MYIQGDVIVSKHMFDLKIIFKNAFCRFLHFIEQKYTSTKFQVNDLFNFILIKKFQKVLKDAFNLASIQ